MSKYHVSTTINGEPAEFLCEPELTLLDVLRDELHLRMRVLPKHWDR